MFKENAFFKFLFIAWIVSAIVTHFFKLPILNYSIQPFEIIFIILLIYSLLPGVFKKWNHNSLKANFPFLLLMGLAVINSIVHRQIPVFIDNIGLIYLASLTILMSTLTFQIDLKDWKKWLASAADIGFWSMNILTGLGLILYFTGIYSKLVLFYPDYPYFGDVARIRGFNFSPNLFLSIYAFFIGLKSAFGRFSFLHVLLAIIIAVISLTKEGLLLVTLVLGIWFWNNTNKRNYPMMALGFAGVLYFVLSQFVFVPTGTEIDFSNSYAVDSEPSFQVLGWTIYPTIYFYLFKSGWLIFKDNVFFGVGHGMFMAQLELLTQAGKYPISVPNNASPIDSYFGVAAELGILYLGYLVVLAQSFYRVMKTLSERYFPLVLLGLYFCFESLEVCTLHFRHYFLFFGICLGLYFHCSKSLKGEFLALRIEG